MTCHQVNQYLLKIGDFPHVKPKPRPELFQKFRGGYRVNVATVEETREAVAKVKRLLPKYKTAKDLAIAIGVSPPYLHKLLRVGMDRMGMKQLDLISQFNDEIIYDEKD